jgi:hypothetical protein
LPAKGKKGEKSIKWNSVSAYRISVKQLHVSGSLERNSKCKQGENKILRFDVTNMWYHRDWSKIFFFSFFIYRPKPKHLKLAKTITVDKNSVDREYQFSDLKREFRNNKSNKMAVDVEDLSDSGIEKACDDASSDIVPNSPRVPPDGADNDDIQIDQLRPHNQQYHQQFSINIYPDKCQQQPQNGSNSSVNFKDVASDDANKISRLNSQLSANQFKAQHEHHTSIPFSSNTYAAFKKGNVVRGILCPSLTNSFRWVCFSSEISMEIEKNSNDGNFERGSGDLKFNFLAVTDFTEGEGGVSQSSSELMRISFYKRF